MNDTFITKKEALKELGLSSRTLYSLVQSGKIVANKINARLIYYSLNSIRAFKAGINS
ncbi:helix-turn-helix transcriptional regulator [Campylobacter gastrosuis]|uniref:Helix-turn-helix domain-containing protein n=1 Tax=Campylobacter gastrosuis TaxID=2974576 RepID=A0ABT7HUC2_9BACT|nr:helix-turn-helix domain-containing protein [Campylobacter gastrosuis]MDL0089989.1 helix-turn-helix domain-containing protein [Campylobacter gastrosuis]